MEAPLINDYKLDLVKRRLWQTFLGGPKLRLVFPARFYIYLVQILFLLIPLCSGILVSFTCPDNLATHLSFGAAWVIYSLVLHILRRILARKGSTLPQVKLSGTALGEEDTIPVGGCWGQDTWLYIIPPKKHAINVILHTLVGSVMMALAMMMLMPDILLILFKNTVTQWILILSGWFTVATAFYSCVIATPPETATFRAYDPYEINCLSRPIHVMIFTSVHIVHRFLGDSNPAIYSADVIAHISFSLLPFFWLCGLLPPIEALLLWIAEQIHTFACGGPTSSSPALLVVSLAMVMVQAIAISNLMSQPFLLVLIGCISGYINSKNKKYRLFSCWCEGEDREVEPPKAQEHSLVASIAKNVLMVGTCVGLSVVLPWLIFSDMSNERSSILLSSNTTYDMASYAVERASFNLGWAVFGVLMLSCHLSAVQQIFILGLFRNPFFMEMGSAPLKRVVEYTHKYLVYKIVPLLLAAFLTCNLYSERNKLLSPNEGFLTFLKVLFVLRSYRWIWQDSYSAMWETTIYHILILIGPNRFSIDQIPGGFCLQLALINFLRHRILNFLTKSQACLLFLFARPGSRHNSWMPPLQALSVIAFPAIVVMMALTALFAAPLLPIFTLPVFFMSYPRPSSFWPKQQFCRQSTSLTSEAADAVYYQQALSHVTAKFYNAAQAGALGSVKSGDHFLIRFEDRLMWCSVAELGQNYHGYIVRGLELQETSCHTLEAAHIDGIFDIAFGDPDYPDRNEYAPTLNPYILHTLTPLTQTRAKLYSDTKNVLTGVIDSPHTLHVMGENFCKVLVWLLVKQSLEKLPTLDTASDYGRKSPLPPFLALNSPIRIASQNQFYATNEKLEEEPTRHAYIRNLFRFRVQQVIRDELRQRRAAIESSTRTQESHRVFKRVLEDIPPDAGKVELDETDDLDLIDTETTETPPRAGTTRSVKASISSLESWPDDDDPLEASAKSRMGRTSRKRPTEPTAGVAASKPGGRMHLADLVYELTLPGLISDKSETLNVPTQPSKTSSKKREKEANKIPTSDSQSQRVPSMLNSNATSKLDLPLSWRQLPVSLQPRQTVARPWLRHCLRKAVVQMQHQEPIALLGPSHFAQIDEEVDNLQEQYETLVNTCASIISQTGFGDEERIFVFPRDCYTLFSGELPTSVGADWLKGHLDLFRLVLKAHRISVKLSLDQVLTGDSFLINTDEVTSMTERDENVSELEQSLQDLMGNWYVGPEGEDEWRKAVLKQVPGIFGIGYHAVKATFTSRLLTLQDMPVRIGRLNAEVVHGIWASLALELLYLTNDDDERFSIQAHPGLLRNLTAQAADPPLGYPVFVAETLTS